MQCVPPRRAARSECRYVSGLRAGLLNHIKWHLIHNFPGIVSTCGAEHSASRVRCASRGVIREQIVSHNDNEMRSILAKLRFRDHLVCV
eukprot:1011156-Prymnesium_polylepis.2